MIGFLWKTKKGLYLKVTHPSSHAGVKTKVTEVTSINEAYVGGYRPLGLTPEDKRKFNEATRYKAQTRRVVKILGEAHEIKNN